MGHRTRTQVASEQCSVWPSGISNHQLQEEMNKILGEGPMQFGPVRQELPVRAQLLKTTSPHHIAAYTQLRAHSEIEKKKKNGKTFTDSHVLRLLRYTHYNTQQAYDLMGRTNPRHFDLTATDLEDVLRKKIVFPVPGLFTNEERPVFYMNPSRYNPNVMPTEAVIDNLLYVMGNMMLQDVDNKKGIAFIANMNDWTMENFSTDYCLKFMQCLQGCVFPAKVELFLIVNPPAWFGKVWKIMKPMLSDTFRKKVHMIKEQELEIYLQPGFEEFLPDEFDRGELCTHNIVWDYITFQQHLEKAVGKKDVGRVEPGRAPTQPKTIGSSLSESSEKKKTFFFSRRNKTLKESHQPKDLRDDTSVCTADKLLDDSGMQK